MRRVTLNREQQTHNTMKKRIAIPLLLLLLSVWSCDKRCQCTKYDGGIDEFTEEELASEGKTCAEKVYYNGLAAQYYSYCEWKY